MGLITRVAVAAHDSGELAGYIAWAVNSDRAARQIDNLAVRESIPPLGEIIPMRPAKARRSPDLSTAASQRWC
jgi:hypothetical protein